MLTVSINSFSRERERVINTAFSLIYDGKYKEAHHEISVNHAVLGKFYADVLTIDLLWWELVEPDQSGDIKNQFLLFLEKFDSSSSDKSDDNLRQLIKNSYLLRYQLHNYNFIRAVSTRNTLKTLLSELHPEELNFPEDRIKLLGLYKTLFTYFDNLVNPLFRKNKKQIRQDSLTQMNIYCKDKDLIVKTLSLYFLGKIYLKIEKERNLGINCFTELSQCYPGNILFRDILEQYHQ